LVRFEFESGILSFCFSFTLVSFRESCLLVLWCAGGRCGMACSVGDRGRSRRPSAEGWRWSNRSGTRWPGDREVGGAVCSLHLARGDLERGFLVEH
jgi:hypothetical protein